MKRVTRLVTFVELVAESADARQMSVSACLAAEIDDGRRVVLLDDRGWTESGPPDIWSTTTAEDLAETARVVVGPDEPFDGRTEEDMAADHWGQLAAVLAQHEVRVDAQVLRRLQHDVVLSERLMARVTSAGL